MAMERAWLVFIQPGTGCPSPNINRLILLMRQTERTQTIRSEVPQSLWFQMVWFILTVNKGKATLELLFELKLLSNSGTLFQRLVWILYLNFAFQYQFPFSVSI